MRPLLLKCRNNFKFWSVFFLWYKWRRKVMKQIAKGVYNSNDLSKKTSNKCDPIIMINKL